MKNKKIIAALMSVLMLSSVAFTGCLDEDWEEEYEDTSVSESMNNTDNTSDSGNADNDVKDNSKTEFNGNGYIEADGVKRGTGIVDMDLVGTLAANPNRSVRRNIKTVKFRPGKMLDGTPLTEEFYMYRACLDDHYVKAYDEIRNGLIERQNEIFMTVPVSIDDISELYKMVFKDDPEFFYANCGANFTYNTDGIVLSVLPSYNELIYYADEYAKRIEDATAEALADMWSLDYDIERVKYAHDYISHTTSYDLNAPFNQNMYSTFVNRVTVCAGYARGFQYMMQKVGIPCTTIYGNAGEPHGWNILKVNGDYYMMDLTWDDPLGNDPNTYYYDYFCITEQEISRNHTRDQAASLLPNATATECNFQNAFGGNAYGTDFDAIHGQMPNVKPDTDSPDNTPQPDNNTQQPDNNNFDDDNWWEEDKPDNDMDHGDGQGWWNLLCSDWTKDDWTKSEELEGCWEIYDPESDCVYLWEEGTNNFFAIDGTENGLYMLDLDTYEWICIDE